MTPHFAVTTVLVVAVCAIVLGTLFVPPIVRRSARPRFVAALCLATLAVVVAEICVLVFRPAASLSTSLVGIALEGGGAALAIGAHVIVQIIVGCGLWLLRPWARLAGMVYVGFLLASFLLWGLGGGRGREPVYVLVWQLCVLPFLTFSFMYLYGGARYFVTRDRTRPESDR